MISIGCAEEYFVPWYSTPDMMRDVLSVSFSPAHDPVTVGMKKKRMAISAQALIIFFAVIFCFTSVFVIPSLLFHFLCMVKTIGVFRDISVIHLVHIGISDHKDILLNLVCISICAPKCGSAGLSIRNL